MTTTSDRTGTGGGAHRIGSYIGLAGLAPLLFLVLASGLVAPLWAVVGLTGVWVALLTLGIRWFTTHPWRVAALPLVMVAVWVAVLAAGDAFLGWTA